MLKTLHRIERVEPLQPYRLRIDYQDGKIVVVDLAATIAQGGVFTPLSDWQVFCQVRADERGRALVWPGEIDMCADALRLQGQQQDQREAG